MKSTALEQYAQNRQLDHRQLDHRQNDVSHQQHTHESNMQIIHTTTTTHNSSSHSNALHSDHHEHDEISQVTIDEHSIDKEEVLRASLTMENTHTHPSATAPTIAAPITTTAAPTVTPSPIRPAGRYDRSSKQQSGQAGDPLRGSIDTTGGSVESEGDSWLHSFIANGGDHPPEHQPQQVDEQYRQSEHRLYQGIATSATPPLPSESLSHSHHSSALVHTPDREHIYEGLTFSENNLTVLNTWDLFTTSLRQSPLPSNLSAYLLNELLNKFVLKLPTVDHINIMYVSLDRMVSALKQELNRQLHLQSSTSTSSSSGNSDRHNSSMREERKSTNPFPASTTSPFPEQCGYCQRRSMRENHIITTERKLANEKLEQAVIGLSLIHI